MARGTSPTVTLARPAHVFLDLFVECNLRCVQCDIHFLHSQSNELTHQEREIVLRDMAASWPDTRLVLTGGELFLKRSALYPIAATARQLGLYTTMNSNGTLIRDADIERLPESGINCIVLSIDSDEAEVHDRIRGVPGTFYRVVRATEALARARDASGCDFTVLTSTIIGSHNLHRVRSMVSFFEGLGVDTTLFQPIQPPFARALRPHWWESDPLFPKDMDVVDRAIDELSELRRSGRRLFQTESQFEDMRLYFRQPRNLPPHQCASADRHLMVDAIGQVRLCFNMERIGLSPIGSVRERPLPQLWSDLETERTRARMRGCSEGCGTMLCHAR